MSTPATGPATGPATTPVNSGWLKTVDLFLYLALLGVPLCLGGRGGWGQLLLIGSAAAASLAWIAGRIAGRLKQYRFSWSEPVLLAGLLWLVLQVLPLPTTMLHSLSPTLANWLPAWSGGQLGNTLGSWSTLSLYPAATTLATFNVVAVAMTLLLVLRSSLHHDAPSSQRCLHQQEPLRTVHGARTRSTGLVADESSHRSTRSPP